MEHGEAIRGLLERRDVAAARHRAAIGRQLGLGETEMLAIVHLARHGELTPSALGALLGLSSAGVSALVQRLGDARYVERARHPTDGRSRLVRLAPTLVSRVSRAYGPLVTELDGLASELGDGQLALVRRFLARVVEASERHAERASDQPRERAPTSPGPVPGPWG